jgi:vanillate O-demethylase ferredoxin subunit
MQLRVRALTWEAEDILGIELVPLERGASLPPFDAGAHVELHLPNGLVRSYSLVNAPGERHRYVVAVGRDRASRGGSRWLHDSLRVGTVLEVDAPRNQFALDEAAPASVLIAGGIGVTPLVAMAHRLAALGRPWTMHVAARSRAHAAFIDTLRALAASGAGTLHEHYDDEAGGVLDVVAIIAALPADAHVYACGPQPMLAAFEAAAAALPPARVHREYFAAPEAPAAEGGFTVRLHRSGRDVPVVAGRTILEALREAGVDVLHSCCQGVCGTCEVAVIAGVPEHRDLVLSPAERAANDRIMICCSGSKTPVLELDL